jgi:hypothetical protein
LPAKKIIETIGKPENHDYKSYLGSPLLLSMFILTYNTYPELPKSKSKFYWNVFDTLCSKHDSFTKKGGWQHERKTQLQNEQFENVLKWFSYISLFEGKYSFDSRYFKQRLKTIKEKLNYEIKLEDLMDDLTTSISIIIIDGFEYKFPHKSLQEYFSALLIKEQSFESKKKIYGDKFAKLSRLTMGGNENFWNLCAEMDKMYFYKFYVLDKFKTFLDKVDSLKQEQRIKNFLLKILPAIDLDIEKNSTISVAAFMVGDSEIDALLDYIDETFSFEIMDLPKYDYEAFSKEVKRLEKENLLETTSVSDWLTMDFEKVWSAKFFKYISKIGIAKEIDDYISRLRNKIKKIESEITKEEKSKLKLLDI